MSSYPIEISIDLANGKVDMCEIDIGQCWHQNLTCVARMDGIGEENENCYIRIELIKWQTGWHEYENCFKNLIPVVLKKN